MSLLLPGLGSSFLDTDLILWRVYEVMFSVHGFLFGIVPAAIDFGSWGVGVFGQGFRMERWSVAPHPWFSCQVLGTIRVICERAEFWE